MGYLDYFTKVTTIDPDYSNFRDFEIRCYFDNDSDELINHKSNDGLVNLDVYRKLVKALKVMGYNAIDIHDQLGRAEFYLWDSYNKYWNYKGDIDHIDKIIDIIHEEGMMVQIPMYLGWAFNPLDERHECWFDHKQTWTDRWNNYMEGPLGKGDLFLLRPRSPIYDCKYRCRCDRCLQTGTGQIMTEVFETIEEIILSHKSEAKLVCDLYAEGYGLFKDASFKVSKKWLLIYADNGFGKFVLEDTYSNGDYRMGIYLHSGFWLNHTVQDPHLTPLYESIKKAHVLNLTDYILVNGQSFKNFILNLEAIISMSHDIDKYDKDAFIVDWLRRVIDIDNSEISSKIIRFIDDFEKFHVEMCVRKAYLSPDEDVDRGFVANSINVLYPLIHMLNQKTDNSYRLDDEQFSIKKEKVLWTHEQSKSYLSKGHKILENVKSIENSIKNQNSRSTFNDQFTFGVELLYMQLKLITLLFEAVDDCTTKDEVMAYHKKFYEFAEHGSKLHKFKDWHRPRNSRRHHPIPDMTIYI